MTFAEEIEQACGGANVILAVVVGDFGWGGSTDEDADSYGFERVDALPFPSDKRGFPQKWDEVRQYLDYNYDRGCGAPECHAVYVYTADLVLLVGTYDGSTYLTRVPRNPSVGKPEMIGGG